MYDPIRILLALPAVVIALTFHELAHAVVADRFGDPTPRQQGRITLNPIAHIDWIGLICFAVFGFGWAKPVQINRLYLRGQKNAQIYVSLAGPMTNLAIAIIVTPILLITYKLTHAMVGGDIIVEILNNIVRLNIVFFFLNILPIPPLDGYHVIKEKLFNKNPEFFLQYERYSMFVLIICVILNVFDIVIGVPTSIVYQFLISIFGTFL